VLYVIVLLALAAAGAALLSSWWCHSLSGRSWFATLTAAEGTISLRRTAPSAALL
jgi:hypothetical protein